MPEASGVRPAVFTIPIHRSFADSLAAGLIARFGADPLGLAVGRILLPNNRAARTVTEAFVRASGSGLLLPRLIPIGDPDLDERIGGALDPADEQDPLPPAIDPLERLTALAAIVKRPDESSAEALRLAADLARTLDALSIEQVDAVRLADAAADAPDLAAHWQKALERFDAVLDVWPRLLADRGRIDLTEGRNRLLQRIADRWGEKPPAGFTVAAGITTSAPAVTALLARVARMPGGMVVVPGLSLPAVMPDEEWETLQKEETHPQYHLKLLLDRIGVARGEVQLWRSSGRASSAAVRTRAVAHAMTAADFSDRWNALRPAERRLSGIRVAELPDPAAEAQAIALAIREAIEVPGRTAALVTPDRGLAQRVSALLERWGIEADDSAGRALSQRAPGTLLLAIAAAAVEDLAPVPLLALLKHPLVGGAGDERRIWLDQVRKVDIALRGPRPAGGLEGLDRHFAERDAERQFRGCLAAWRQLRSKLKNVAELAGSPATMPEFARLLADSAQHLAGDRAWMGQDGRSAADLIAQVQELRTDLAIGAEDAVPVLRRLLDEVRVRPAYGGHPRVFIWGLLEARLQQADLMILGGLNEGVWPALPSPDPWLAPKIRANLGLPGLDFRVGLAAHDFASALGAPQVLITRARRDSRSPTVASRLWLRLQAMTGGLPHDTRLERLATALDDPGAPQPADRPAPKPTREKRPTRISVTAVDRLNADPFAFYAQQVLKLRKLDDVDADHSAAWKGTAVHKVLELWLAEDQCDPDRLIPRARALLAGQDIHAVLRALWQPRLMEAVRWIERQERDNQSEGRLPVAAEKWGEAVIDGVTLHGKADRIDRLADGSLAIVDYKTGKPPSQKAVMEGFALQLGLLGLIAEAGGFEDVSGAPRLHEYWSLSKFGDQFGRCVRPGAKMSSEEFLDHARRNFAAAAGKWLTGDGAFTAKLNPAYAPYGDYDQLMRLEEWYGRS